MKATGGTQGMELPDYVNQPSKPEPNHGASNTDRKQYTLFLLFLGLLFIIQATLNVALRLSLFSGDDVLVLDCNNTGPTENCPVFEECGNNFCNNLQEKFNALARDKNLLENTINLLTNKIKTTEEERDRLDLMLSDQQTSCPQGWILLQSKCYYISEALRTWENSRSYCIAHGADLMVVNSRDEQVSLNRWVQNSEPLWIGLGDTNGLFHWVDGSDLSIKFWKSGQPDHGGPLTREDCVEMDPKSPVERSWNDASCSDRLRWVCEMKTCNTAIIFPIK